MHHRAECSYHLRKDGRRLLFDKGAVKIFPFKIGDAPDVEPVHGSGIFEILDPRVARIDGPEFHDVFRRVPRVGRIVDLNFLIKLLVAAPCRRVETRLHFHDANLETMAGRLTVYTYLAKRTGFCFCILAEAHDSAKSQNNAGVPVYDINVRLEGFQFRGARFVP